MKKNHKFTPMRRLIFFLLIGLVLVQLPAQWAVVGLENNPFLTTPTLESTQENNPKASGLPPGTGAGACDNLLRLSEDLSLPNGVGRQLRAFFDSKPPGVGVKAWEVLENSADDAIRALKTDVPTLTRFTDNFGDNAVAISQLKNSPDLLETWVHSGHILHRHYPGAGAYPTVNITSSWKTQMRVQYGDKIGDMIDEVDNLNISNTEQVGAGLYHPSLYNNGAEFIIAKNFRSSEYQTLAQEFVDNAHPIIKKRVKYLEFLDEHNLLNASTGSIDAAGKFGAHAEARVLDKALKDIEIIEGLPGGSFPESRLGEFDVFVKYRGGTCPPRCVACWNLSDGVRMIGNE